MSACPIQVLSAVSGPTDIPAQPVTEGEQAGLLLELTTVPDPRSPRGLRYPLEGLLTVGVCAVLAGASSVTAIADWLHDLDDIARARLGFLRAVPPVVSGLARWLTERSLEIVSPPRPRYGGC